MAAPDMLFGRQGMHIPACPVGCLRLAAEITPGQASKWAPTVQAPDLTYWAAVGGQPGHKRQ